MLYILVFANPNIKDSSLFVLCIEGYPSPLPLVSIPYPSKGANPTESFGSALPFILWAISYQIPLLHTPHSQAPSYPLLLCWHLGLKKVSWHCPYNGVPLSLSWKKKPNHKEKKRDEEDKEFAQVYEKGILSLLVQIRPDQNGRN